MEIIIPANRIEGDINSQIIIDNEITKIEIQNYNVEKKVISEDNNISSPTIEKSNNYIKSNSEYKSFFGGEEGKRVEVLYTTGQITITTDANIDNLTKFAVALTGKHKKGQFKDYGSGVNAPQMTKSYWEGSGEKTELNEYIEISSTTDLTNSTTELKIPTVYGVTVANESSIKIIQHSLSQGTTKIKLDFKVITGIRKYHYKYWSIMELFNSVEKYDIDSFSIQLRGSVIDLNSNEDMKIYYGEGTKLLSYKSNELFQLKNTYNDGEKDISIGEFIANQVLAIYKDGRKTIKMTALTDNLIVSDNKLENGHYGVRGRLERLLYKVGDSVIPYKVNTKLQELPNSEYLGIPQSFKVVENEVKYDGKLTQSLKTQENTYFNIYYDEGLLGARRDNIVIGSGDRIFREEEITIQPVVPYSEDFVVFLDINEETKRLEQDSEDLTKYSKTKTKVNGFITLNLTSKQFKIISGEPVEEYVYNPEYSQNLGFAIGYDTPLINFVESSLHKVSVTVITESKLADFFPEAYPPYEETQVVVSEDNGYRATTMVGREKTVKLELGLYSENSISVTCFNSSVEKITYIKINSVAQVES